MNPTQLKWQLVVATNSYTGNFIEEFCAFVLGYACVISNDVKDNAAEECLRAFGPVLHPKDPTDLVEIESILEDYFDVSSSFTSNTYYPARSSVENDKNIIVTFDKDPTELLDTILTRLEAFPKFLKDNGDPRFGIPNVKIKSVDLQTVTTLTTTIFTKKFWK